MKSLVLLLRDVVLELEAEGSIVLISTCQSASSSTMGIGRRKEEMPKELRERWDFELREVVRLCKGSISHSGIAAAAAAAVLVDHEARPLSEVDGRYND